MLSFADRATLIQSFLLALPTYALSAVHLPVTLLNQMEKEFWAFLWGHSFDTRGFHRIAWEKICLPKSKGGLGFSSLSHRKQQCLSRLVVYLILHLTSLWLG